MWAPSSPRGFGFPQRSPQPGARRVVQCLAGQIGRQGAAQRVLESGGLDAADHVVPDSAEDAQVVGAEQFVLECFGGRQFAAVAQLLTALEADLGLPEGHFKLVPLIESARGLAVAGRSSRARSRTAPRAGHAG
jgi:hypothetical protein